MVELPRIALRAAQPNVDVQPSLFALLWTMAELDIDTQVFASQSRLDTWNLPAFFPEQRVRHLDSWLMTPEVSRCCLLQGGMPHDLAVVVDAGRHDAACRGLSGLGGDWEGRIASGSAADGHFPNLARDPTTCGNADSFAYSGLGATSHDVDGAELVNRWRSSNSLDHLCQWLDLPLILVVDVSSLDPCLLPRPPARTVAVLLDGCRDTRDLAVWQTRLGMLWDLPVIGGICADPVIRARWAHEIRRVSSGDLLGGSAEFLDELGSAFARHVRRDWLLLIAQSASQLCDRPVTWSVARPYRPVHVAVAYDDAINCYFPDSLEWLEAMGARVTDFSPLSSESIPADADLIWLGCGHPERYAERLAGNVCLLESLRARARAGARIYAEGGGVSLICASMACHGHRYPMAGILPAQAEYQETGERDLQPVDFLPVGQPWLGAQPLRGYLNPSWTIRRGSGESESHDPMLDYSADSPYPLSLVGDGRVIASRIQLHFASQPGLLCALLAPHFVS
jgi:cobyrinic acid a,c-diamide synthase